jgi:hypothetical protein
LYEDGEKVACAANISMSQGRDQDEWLGAVGTPHAGEDTTDEARNEVVEDCGCPEVVYCGFIFDFLPRYLGDEMFLNWGFTYELSYRSFVCIVAPGPSSVNG